VIYLQLFESLLVFLLYLAVANSVEHKLDDPLLMWVLAILHQRDFHKGCILNVDSLNDGVELQQPFNSARKLFNILRVIEKRVEDKIVGVDGQGTLYFTVEPHIVIHCIFGVDYLLTFFIDNLRYFLFGLRRRDQLQFAKISIFRKFYLLNINRCLPCLDRCFH